MPSPPREYQSDEIVVAYDAARCIHAGECVRGLPATFDTKARPWINPNASSADAIAEVVERCPSGALTYRRLDGGTEETPAGGPAVRPERSGPLYLSGASFALVDAEEGVLVSATRIALCRCGQSANKPFCDNSHEAAGFEAP